MKYYLLFLCLAFASVRGTPLPACADSTVTWTDDPLLHPDSIIAFAEYLQENGDYARACGEYKRALESGALTLQTSRLREQIARCYLKLQRYDTAAALFGALADSTKNDTLFLRYGTDRYRAFTAAGEQEKAVAAARLIRERTGSPRALAMEVSACLHRNDTSAAVAAVHSCVSRSNSDSTIYPLVESWIERYESLPRKNAVVAALCSAVLPGGGKIYAGRIRDGLFTAGILSFFTLQCYDGFHHHRYRSVKGWLFSAIVLDFYAANIYGSILEVRSHNSRMTKDLLNDIEFSLKVQILGL